MIITLKQQKNNIQLDNKLLDGEVDMMALHKLFTQGIFYLLFSYSNSQSNCLIFFVTNSLKIVELATLLVLQDNNKT